MLTDILLFLTICPAGLCMTEAVFIIDNLIHHQTEGEDQDSAEKITFVQDLMKAFEQIDRYGAHLNETEIQKKVEIDPRIEHIVKKIREMNLIEIKLKNELENELQVKISRDCKEPLTLLVRSERQLEKGLSSMSKHQIYYIAIEFFSPYASFLLYNIRDRRRRGDLDHRLLSAHIGFGMWDKMQDEEELDNDFSGISDYEARFIMNEWNFMNLINIKTINEFFPEILSEPMPLDHE